jgi:hypothetical protein
LQIRYKFLNFLYRDVGELIFCIGSPYYQF